MSFLKKIPRAQRFFDKWAPGYEASLRDYRYSVPETLFNAVWPYVAARAETSDMPLRVLDIGIGTGLSAAPFRATGKTYIVGLDVSKAMLALCRAKGVADELHHCEGGRVDFPCESQSFDIVIAGGVLEFVDDSERLFEEIQRVLKPGGILAVTHETPETKTLYKTGLLEGVIEDGEHSVIIRRSYFHRFLPRAYYKYLQSARNAENLFILNDISVLQSSPFKAYEWGADQKITYNLIVGQRF